MGSHLEGARLTRVEMDHVELTTLRGGVVGSVRAVGKHLLIGVGDVYLRSHLGLHGSWHRYPKGAGWKRPPWQSSLTLETAEDTYVCFQASEVDCIKSSRMSLHRPLTRLGPDLLGGTINYPEILRRFRRVGAGSRVADVLLDQSVASGIGNVYKSEVLFLTGHAPQSPASSLSDQEAVSIYREARAQLQANLHRARRMTTGSLRERLWVYRRSGHPCLRCERLIAFARMGRGRSTYWCPHCQPSGTST